MSNENGRLSEVIGRHVFFSEMHQAGIARIDIPLWALFLGESLMKAHDPSADLSRKKRSLVCLSSSFSLVRQSSFDSRPVLIPDLV